MQPFGVPAEVVPKIWHRVEGLIVEACAYNGGRYRAEDHLNELMAGIKQLWMVVSGDDVLAVVITEIIDYPRKRCATIHICTGNGLAEWAKFLPTIEAWAREHGCAEMFLMARPGMERALRDQNYQKSHVLLEKTL